MLESGRFLNACGEQLSLPAMEQALVRRFPPLDARPRVAVVGIDQDGRHRLVLFTTETTSLQEANALLIEAGFHSLMRLDEIRRLDRIPTRPSGEIDHDVLRAELLRELEFLQQATE